MVTSVTTAFSSASVNTEPSSTNSSLSNDSKTLIAQTAAIKSAENLVKLDCPIMYREGWLPDPQGRGKQMVAGCPDAWNNLVQLKATNHVKFLVQNDCPIIYREGWRPDPNERGSAPVVPGCPAAWNALIKLSQ
ncbi:hypothetical protein QUA82_19125 [Microcoleus sp. F8-D3]